jgi:predicted kinase
MYVVVTGAPGSGKSTIARSVAIELGLPLLSKDTVKEALIDVLGADGVGESQRVGRAAIRAMLAVAVDARAGVLDSVWRPELARRDLRALPGPVVEVFCRCPPELAKRRYSDRARSRHAGHVDEARLAGGLWEPGATGPVAGPWPVLAVDTTGEVVASELAAEVRRALHRNP